MCNTGKLACDAVLATSENIHRWLPLRDACLMYMWVSLAFREGFACWLLNRLRIGFAFACLSTSQWISLRSLRFAFGFNRFPLSAFWALPWFGLVLGFAFKLRLWLTFQFLQASPSVSVFKSSVPSDFASLENLSGCIRFPHFAFRVRFAHMPIDFV